MKIPLAIVAALLSLGCPPPPEKHDAGSGCTTVGQSCEFSPGKLGACVKRDDCTKEPCFVCQSQH